MGAAGFTVIAELVTERAPEAAVRVREPAVFRVREKEPTPLVRVAEAGSVAFESDEVIATVPAKPVAVLLWASRAVTVKLKAVPAVALVGTELRTRLEAAAGFTVVGFAEVVMVPSEAVMVCEPAVRRVMTLAYPADAMLAVAGRVAFASVTEIVTGLVRSAPSISLLN